MQRPLVVPRSPPPAVTSRRTLMGLIGSGMCLSDVTCPQPPAEHPLSRITRTAVLLSLVRAPALPPRHAYFGSQSHTPYDRCLRFGPRVAATPARLAPVPLAQLWTDQTCTGKLIPASPIAPRTGLLSEVERDRPFRAWAARLGSIRGSAPLVTRRSRRCVRGVLQHRPLPPTGSLPSALSATAPHGFVRGFLQYYGPIRLLACSPTASPSRLPVAARDRSCDCGPDEVSQVPARSLLA